MARKQVGATSRLMAELPLGTQCEAAQRDFIAANREEILEELLDATDPNVPPTDEEILDLILGEIVLIERTRPLPAMEGYRVSGSEI